MGLAASQARYLSLTARKTNVEYEGQQVNQERTALANQSAALFNEMLALDVPTPPSATDFSKTVYTYVDPSTSQAATIDLDSIIKNKPDPDTNEQTYTISGYKKENSWMSNKSDIVANGTNINGYTISYDKDKKKYIMSVNGGTGMTLSGPSQFNGLTDSFIEAEKNKGNKNESTYPQKGDYYFTYTNAQTGVQYFIKADDENDTLENLYKKYTDYRQNFDIYSAQSYVDNKYFHFDDALMTTASDGTGRFTSISFFDDSQYVTGDDGVKRLKENAVRTMCKLTQETQQDDEAFDAAMETYEAKKALYDKTVSEIDAKTTVIQQQDKTLELHLNQLDTEQQAIQTELDAVKKVIDKNIEETFKIFA